MAKNKNKPAKVVEPQLVKRGDSVDEFIRKTLLEIRDKSNLGDYDINYRFSNKRKIHGRQEVSAEIVVDPRYLNAHITLRPQLIEMFKAGKLDRIKRTLCHEIAHIRTEKLAEIAMERFTTMAEVRQELEVLTEIVGRLMYDTVFHQTPTKVQKKKEAKK